jgi:orotidine-5'-phosphate decarboxylase
MIQPPAAPFPADPLPNAQHPRPPSMTELIVALDVASARDARGLVHRCGPGLDFVKVGLELFTREGPEVVRILRGEGLRVFLDLKLHDIPNTVAGAVHAARELDVELLTVHASGGPRMLAAAAEASGADLRLLAVTVLTSLGADELAASWGRAAGDVDPAAEADRLAALAACAGLGGVVCSPREAAMLRSRLGPDAAIVTPGIRFAGGDAHDQARVATPASAVRAGASHLVLGRAVTAHASPADALAQAKEEVAGAMAESGSGAEAAT